MKRGPNHGYSRTRLYQTWRDMKNRCDNIFAEKYKYYRRKGIRVCKEWNEDFLAFRQWALENGYNETLQIDRIDNHKDYSPENCRWVSPKNQQRNRTNNIYLTAFGETKLLTEWMEDERCIVKLQTLRKRLHSSWPPEQALTHALILNQFSKKEFSL